MDASCLARLLSGVARCGAWGCFDEFNRLEHPALAAAAHQLTALLAALAARDEHVVLQGKKVFPLRRYSIYTGQLLVVSQMTTRQ